MNVFEFAMQMEKDGEKFYREIAEKTKDAGLKKIFNTLADEEVIHYNTFKSLHEKTAAKAVESNVLEKAKNIFTEMKAKGGLQVSDDTAQVEAYKKAMKAEEEAYTFYEKKAAEAADENEKNILLTFAREERRHYRLLENVIEFVSRPEQWMEDAEFANMDQY
ncbi:ferritin-like domain-containing protein [Desulfopila aestuarii]|uniref:Rubrerythrin n=1 Tax=Desulfopila aestuarii DSM 18488 TaxID=1121416 RepID=A0A1M7YJC8_9BACT|nr:ferritin family protein [Desulfopila aestuarii]SHO52715.1 Rubrerythrin [Desulfopila aestuarii DSM 18488]